MKLFQKAAACFLSCALLAGCGQSTRPESTGAAAAQEESVPMGRYIETEITPPAPPDVGNGEDIVPISLIPHGDGSLDYFFSAEISNGPDKSSGVTTRLYHYHSPDGGTAWEQKEISWLEEAASICGVEMQIGKTPAADEYLDQTLAHNLDMDSAGNLYCTVYDGRLDYHHLLKVTPDGAVRELPVSGWQLERFVPLSLSASAEGAVGVAFDNGYAALYDGEVGSMLVEAKEDYGVQFAWSDQPAAFSEGQIAMLDQGGQLVLYSQGIPKAYELPQMGDAVTADAAANLYVASHKGVICLGKGMSAFETVMSGSLYQYSDPSRYIRSFRYEPETDTFYMILGASGGEGKIQLYRYSYDPNMPRKPDKQLNVFSLEESGTVRKAMLEFQMKHPDVAVNYTVAYTEDYTLSEEAMETARTAALRALEQKVQTGGADVVILDGLDGLQAYIDKGSFADLGKLSELDGCFSIAADWKRGGKIWAVSTRFAVCPEATDSYQYMAPYEIEQMFHLSQAAENGGFHFAEVPFHTAALAAVSAGSGQQELAKDFIACMLSDAVQSVNYEDGLPVSAAAFDQQAARTYEQEAAADLLEVCNAIKEKLKN